MVGQLTSDSAYMDLIYPGRPRLLLEKLDEADSGHRRHV